MKHLLLAAATEAEIAPFLGHLYQNWTETAPGTFELGQVAVTVCITGVGLMATAFSLASLMALHSYDAALQAGIGGAFDTDLSLGSLVRITSEQLGDLGAEDHDQYIDIFSLGFLEKDTFPFTQGFLPATAVPFAAQELPAVTSLSINTVSGSAGTIERRKAHFGCAVESMEGAAFHYACLRHNIPFVQIRAISNYVTPRDRSKWQIKAAIDALNNWLIALAERQFE
jgi:futalosine hydrolase